MNLLMEIARSVFGANPTPEQVEAIRHERHHLDADE